MTITVSAKNSATSYAKDREGQAMELARQVITFIDDNAVLFDGDEPATELYRAALTFIKHATR